MSDMADPPDPEITPVRERPVKNLARLSAGRPLRSRAMPDERHHDVTTPDGRTLRVLDVGVEDGPAIVAHHGTPGGRALYRLERESAQERGVRLISYDRPGYGGSTSAPGRVVAGAAADVAAILDALGVERFATYGGSGGG